MERHLGLYFLALCPCSSESASLSFDFWLYKMGMIVASSSQSCREEKISVSNINTNIYLQRVSSPPGIVLGYFTGE